jgi:hypothetical protein
MYKKFIDTLIGGLEIEQIFYEKEDGSVICFQNVEENLGQERLNYLDWLAQGNTPEEWNNGLS